jgi:Flp pilus assembly protein TadD
MKVEVPTLPIVTLAEATTSLAVGGPTEARSWTVVPSKDDRERWNDWGIGLLLQGDLKAAEYAFRKVTEMDPSYADGWLNVARALIQEGETGAAKPFIERALKLDPAAGRVHYFRALTQKADGDYEGALASLETVARQFPRDRVVLNQMARILFLQRRFADALEVLDRVCLVDPEDVQMHYSRMLNYRALGDKQQALREETLFKRFKADESAQSITAIRRSLSPEDNNERQAIHDHDSVPLGALR